LLLSLSTPTIYTLYNSKEGSQGKIIPTLNDAILPGSLTDIVEEHFWKDYQTGMMIMQGKCYFPINKILKDFYVVVILDQDTIAYYFPLASFFAD
jgi:hypothetical protein